MVIDGWVKVVKVVEEVMVYMVLVVEFDVEFEVVLGVFDEVGVV